jgi:hypothetical protein
VFAYRTSIHSTTGVSPYEIIYGRKAVLPIDIQFQCHINNEEQDFISEPEAHLKVVKEKVGKNTHIAKKMQKKQYDRKLNFKPYQIGDRVRMYLPTLKKGMTKKFIRPWVGPFTVAEKLSDLLYRLSDGDGRVSKNIHYNRLQACKSRKIKTKHVQQMSEVVQENYYHESDDEEEQLSGRNISKSIPVLSKAVLPVENIGQPLSLPTIEEIEEPELKKEEKEGPEATEDVFSSDPESEQDQESQSEQESDPEPEQQPKPIVAPPQTEQAEATTRRSGRVSVPPKKFVPGLANPKIKDLLKQNK